jgi:hypothetical protein
VKSTTSLATSRLPSLKSWWQPSSRSNHLPFFSLGSATSSFFLATQLVFLQLAELDAVAASLLLLEKEAVQLPSSQPSSGLSSTLVASLSVSSEDVHTSALES